MRNLTSILSLITLVVCVNLVSAARILVVLPLPAFSHNLIYRTIYKELSLRGHQVVVFTPNPLSDNRLINLTEINTSSLYRTASSEEHRKLLGLHAMQVVHACQKQVSEDSNKIFAHPQMKALLDNPQEHFDLFMVEWSINPGLVILSKRFSCPMVGLRALGLRLEGHDSVGNPTNPSYIPVGILDFDGTLFRRLHNFLFEAIARAYYHLVTLANAQRLVDELFPDISGNILEIEKTVSVVLTGTHPLLTTVRPLVSAVVEIGGVHVNQTPLSLPRDIEEFLGDTEDGFVFVSFGSIWKLKHFSPNLLRLVVEGMAELPYTFICKMNEDEWPKLPPNVKIWSWLPQEAVLGHPNIKAFVTHGGLQSVQEAVANAVPLVGIPVIGDQILNVRRIEDLRIGKRLDARLLTKQSFVAAVKEVIQNPIYRKNIKNVALALQEQPSKPLDEALWWIEYILRHKGMPGDLKSAAVDMNWFIYLSLDIVSFLLSCLGLTVIVCYLTIRLLGRLR